MKLRPLAKGAVETLDNGMVQHADGVWCNLAFDDYLNDTALGSSDLHAIGKSPFEWWWHSRWNPLRPPEPEKKAFLRGTAAHVAFLDGLKVYERTYGLMPDKHSHPDALNTIPELKAAARGAGLYFPSDIDKDDLVSRMLAATKRRVKKGETKPSFVILKDLQNKFLKTGRLPISRDDDAIIRILHRLAMRTHEELGLPKEKPIPRQMLTGGVHEISVFWTDENGIRQCARFDKLKPNVTGDLKTITDWRRGNFKADLLEEAARRGYFGQWAHYDEARRQLRKAVDEGRVFGATAVQLKRLVEIASAEEWAWSWLFIKCDGAPQVRAVIPSRDEGHYVRAVEDRQRALDLFVYYREMFGLTSTWLDTEVVWIPEHHEYPEYFTPRNAN